MYVAITYMMYFNIILQASSVKIESAENIKKIQLETNSQSFSLSDTHHVSSAYLGSFYRVLLLKPGQVVDSILNQLKADQIYQQQMSFQPTKSTAAG